MTRSCARLPIVVFGGLCLTLGTTTQPAAADLQSRGNWSALVADRSAAQIGDSLTVLIFEASSATNSAQNGSKKSTRAGGRISSGTTNLQPGDLSLSSAFDGSLSTAFDGGGQSARVDKMVAQISVIVVDVLANGDLQVAGQQALDINGEHARIKLRGRVRPVDISSNNTVASSRIAEAQINYNGTGFVSRSARPGIVASLFSWLGLF